MAKRLIIAVLLMTIIAALVALVPPVFFSARVDDYRHPCLNNQRQIAIALLQYESEKGRFPPAYVADKNGKPMHSWRVLILPYLDRKDLYDQYDFNEPWDGPHNRLLADRMPAVFRCPNNRNSPNCTSYAMLVGPHTIHYDPKNPWHTWSLANIPDGAAITLLLVEAADAKINWLEPRDLNIEEMSFVINKSRKEISSHHPHGAFVSFCDGHTMFLADTIKPETLKALTTVDGHESVSENDF